MNPIKIDIPKINLKGQSVTKINQVSIELNHSYIRYIADFKADEPKIQNDFDGPWESCLTLKDIVVLKSEIASIEVNNFATHEDGKDAFAVYIATQGCTNEIRAYYNTRAEAYALQKTLLAWWLPNFQDNRLIKDLTKANEPTKNY